LIAVGVEIQRNFRWFLHLLVSKASFPRRIVLWLFVLFQGSLVAVSNQIQSLLLLLDADLCAVWTFGALGFRIIQAIRKIQIARSTLLVFTEKKKKDAPHPHAKYTAAYVMFFSKGV